MHKLFIPLLFIALNFAVPGPAYAQFSGAETWAGTAGGSANSITLSIANVGSISDLLGVRINFIVGAAANTSTTTLASGGTAATPIKKNTSTGLAVLAGGEFQPGNIVSVIFDGTEYVINSPVPTTAVSAAQNIQLFASNGSYNPSTGIAGIYVQCWGGGGGGAGGTSVGGAGGGEYRAGTFPTPVSPVAITIGPGGAPGANPGNGTDGGNTIFGSLITAKGGGAGQSPSSGGAGGTGGTGGNVHVDGHRGGDGFTGGLSIQVGGSGGSAYNTSGTSINIGAVGTAGTNGSFPGGGGAGSNVGATGGTGSGGACLVQELI